MNNYLDFHHYICEEKESKVQFFDQILKKIGNSYYSDSKLLREELIDRESEGCSIIASGLAMPHIVSENINRNLVAIVRIPGGFPEWCKDMFVDTAIILLVRNDSQSDELETIQRIIKKLSKEENCDFIRMGTMEEIEEMLMD